ITAVSQLLNARPPRAPPSDA
ncbi:response regulator, partial [Sinorhizobium medicae]